MNVRAYLAEDETRYRDMETGTVLVRIETSKLNRIEEMLNSVVDDDLPLVSVKVASNPNYILSITRWDDDEIHYSIEVQNDTTGDMTEDDWEATRDQEDYLSSHLVPLEGCQTDEDMQVTEMLAALEDEEHQAEMEELTRWMEGRGYGDFSDAPVDGAIEGVDHD